MGDALRGDALSLVDLGLLWLDLGLSTSFSSSLSLALRLRFAMLLILKKTTMKAEGDVQTTPGAGQWGETRGAGCVPVLF